MQVIYTKDVIKFVAALDLVTKTKVLRLVDMLEKYGYNVRMPYSKALSAGLFELRVRGTLEIRIIYAFKDGGATLLHAFIKKSDRISRSDIQTALRKLST